MRGKRDFIHFRTDSTGITPADAGKTVHPSVFQYIVQDHPRGCGENSILLKLHVAAEGSPPRMRGKH